MSFEINKAHSQMKKDKSPGRDGITLKLFKAGGKSTRRFLQIS